MSLKIVVTSESDPDIKYELDKKNETCTCPAFTKGLTRPCKHLKKHFGLKEGGFLKDNKGEVDLTKKAEIYTVGHSNHSIEHFLQLLEDNEIEILVDVRSRPYSKYMPHFSKPALSQTIKDAGLQYFFGGKVLGGLNAISVDDPEFEAKIKKVLSLGQGAKLAMMCSEGDPSKCHRAYKLSAWFLRHGVKPKHIMPKGGTIDAQELEDSLSDDWLDIGFQES